MEREIDWADLWDAEGVFLPDRMVGAEEITVWGAESPRAEGQVIRREPGSGTNAVKAETAQPLEMERVPDEVQRLTLNLVGDLSLRTHIDAELSVMANQPLCVAIEGLVTALSARSPVLLGASRYVHDQGATLYATSRFVVDWLELAEPLARNLGGLRANVVSLPAGADRLDLRRPVLSGAEWMFDETISIGEIRGQSERLTLLCDRTLELSRWQPTQLVVKAQRNVVRVGSAASSKGTLEVEANRFELSSGQLEGVVFSSQVEEVVLGNPIATDETDRNNAFYNAMMRSAEPATLLGVRGSVGRLIAHERSTVVASESYGLEVAEVDADESSELFNIAAHGLSTASVVSLLNHGGSLSLWTPAKAGTAAQQFRMELASADQLGRERIAMRRALLLRLAEQSSSDGHVLAVVREAERDARRVVSPPRSRERILLSIQRAGFGYGERIAWPLLVGAVLILVLGLIEVGITDLNSRSWWLDTDEERIMNAFEFALPGLGFLGLDHFDGVWALMAKVVSTVCIASALAAGRKLVRAR